MNLLKVSTIEPTPLADLDEIEVVLGWRNAGPTKQRGLGSLRQRIGGPKGTDLDAAALLCDARGGVISACSVDDLDPFRGAIVHGGDDSGKGREASESIAITLSRLSDRIEAVVLTLTSFTGKGFDTVNQTSFELLVHGELRAETFVPINTPRANAAIMTVLRREPINRLRWEIQEIGELVYVDPHFGGNRDGAVTWRDLGEQHAKLFRVRR